MKDNNRELIDLIKDGLKKAGELPYKEGAWEAYKAKYEPVRKIRRLTPLWVAAALATVVGFTFLFRGRDGAVDSDNVAKIEQTTPLTSEQVGSDVDTDADADRETDRLAAVNVGENENSRGAVAENHAAVTTSVPGQLSNVTPRAMQQRIVMPYSMNLQSFEPKPLGSAGTLNREIKAANAMILAENGEPITVPEWDDDLINGQQIDPNFAYQDEAGRNLSPKKVRLTDRFELGAFVSPSTTDRSFDLGGGLVFAYRFNDKIAIRTGASFNQYEVGMLGSQVQEVQEEKIMQSAAVGNSDKLISKEITALRNTNLFIPNLNAVTGKVQTLDIPLEVKYNLTKQFYATGGVSYAAVLSQERFDHYEESVGIPTYSSTSDSKEPVQNTVSTVSTTVKSDDNNVNTNGFGGFVNFSIGRKANVGKTMKVSVEPFVKFPVGQFRRADMNYTNGGIRIITSF